MTDLLLAAHVIGAFSFAGGLGISLTTLALAGGTRDAIPRLVAVANPVMTVGMLLVFASGIWMAIDLDVVTESWLVIAFVLFVGLDVPNRLLIAPRLAGQGSPAAAAAGVGLTVAAVLAIAVLMVLKPAAPASLLVAAGMVAAGPAIAVAASQRRSATRPPARRPPRGARAR